MYSRPNRWHMAGSRRSGPRPQAPKQQAASALRLCAACGMPCPSGPLAVSHRRHRYHDGTALQAASSIHQFITPAARRRIGVQDTSADRRAPRRPSRTPGRQDSIALRAHRSLADPVSSVISNPSVRLVSRASRQIGILI